MAATSKARLALVGVGDEADDVAAGGGRGGAAERVDGVGAGGDQGGGEGEAGPGLAGAVEDGGTGEDVVAGGERAVAVAEEGGGDAVGLDHAAVAGHDEQALVEGGEKDAGVGDQGLTARPAPGVVRDRFARRWLTTGYAPESDAVVVPRFRHSSNTPVRLSRRLLPHSVR